VEVDSSQVVDLSGEDALQEEVSVLPDDEEVVTVAASGSGSSPLSSERLSLSGLPTPPITRVAAVLSPATGGGLLFRRQVKRQVPAVAQAKPGGSNPLGFKPMPRPASNDRPSYISDADAAPRPQVRWALNKARRDRGHMKLPQPKKPVGRPRKKPMEVEQKAGAGSVGAAGGGGGNANGVDGQADGIHPLTSYLTTCPR
jgi:hypothetical protein